MLIKSLKYGGNRDLVSDSVEALAWHICTQNREVQDFTHSKNS